MEEMLAVIEYKVKHELFRQKFLYNEKCLDSIEGLLYINTISGEELVINRDALEYKIERPLRIDESYE